jgi:hypothetical protein
LFGRSFPKPEEGLFSAPTNCLDFSLAHHKQIQLLQSALDNILLEKAALINCHLKSCPNCPGEVIKLGKRKSTFHDVFTDHEIKMQRARCSSCGFEAPSTVRTFLKGNTMSGELAKIQSELGAENTFRDSEEIFEKFSAKPRKINNHNRIKLTAESIGTSLKVVNQDEKSMVKIEESKELILNVDGGHVKSKDPEFRSFEAMTSVLYKPDAIKSNKKGTRNYLSSKFCATSTLDDGGKEMISNTIVAAIKAGMTPNTHLTALSDGAKNCWKIIDALKPLCKKVTAILDWFHISMKMENISLPENIKPKFLRVKWHLWRGNVSFAMIRLHQLKEMAVTDKALKKLTKFITYIDHNQDTIVDYRKRKNAGLVFTSHLAESTVESLINQRCKGQQHMKWSREGLDPILQLRAQINSATWNAKWKTAVLTAL